MIKINITQRDAWPVKRSATTIPGFEPLIFLLVELGFREQQYHIKIQTTTQLTKKVTNTHDSIYI